MQNLPVRTGIMRQGGFRLKCSQGPRNARVRAISACLLRFAGASWATSCTTRDEIMHEMHLDHP
jgi:hypothetical protein